MPQHGNRDWLTSAAKAGDFIATFRDEAGGFVTSKTAEGKTGVLARPARLIDDQVQVAGFTNLLNRYFGNESYREQAAHAMRYLASASAGMMRPLPGILLADEEARGRAHPHHHRRTQGRRPREKPHALARALPTRYKRLEWLDLREGKLPNPDVEYPDLGEARGIRLQQPHLLVSLLQRRGVAGHGRTNGETETGARIAQQNLRCATQAAGIRLIH